MTRYQIDLQPVGRRVQMNENATLLDAAQESGVELVSICGGIGVCSGCRVRLVEGKLTPVTLSEEAELSRSDLASGFRLACQASPLSDIKLDIPPESLTTPQRLQLEGEKAEVDLDPVIQAIDVQLPTPTITDFRPDVRRLSDHLDKVYEVDTAVMRQFACVARAHHWSVRLAVRSGTRIVAVLPPKTRLLGLAVDVGTTGLAAYLVDLDSGETLTKVGAMNPQIAYGEDVISRIVYSTTHEGGADTLQTRLVDTLNNLIDTLCQEAAVHPQQIVEAVLVGNTVMHHLVAGLPVEALGIAPYVPVTQEALSFSAALIGLNIAPGAQVYLPSLIAGYVGTDHVAMLLATDTWRTAKTTIALDIGTNTEITLAHGGQRWSCSCASGPAFEGAHITDGMRAAPGAVERVQILDGAVKIQTIGNKPAVGICGSGILDAIAVMAEHGIVDYRGAVNQKHPLISERVFTLAPAMQTDHGRAVTVSRQDVSEIQLAKAAIRAGIEILLNEAKLTSSDIQSFIIAGAFGTYISIESAVRIGMFPALPRERFKQVGNAAGMGACQLLVSQALRTTAAHIVSDIQYVELTTHAEFQNVFVTYLPLHSENGSNDD
jgi:uncharacterized 2Fe-2S/4Fe-4S cluster protein (DUF4445 family)